MNITILENCGLSQNEAKAYLALLELGSATSGAVISKSGINSGKIYEILESLERKGLISESRINKVRTFTAGTPKQLLDLINKEQERVELQRTEMLAVLPQLENIRKESSIARAVTYQGFKGFLTVVSELMDGLTPEDDVIVMGATGKKEERYNRHWKKHHTEDRSPVCHCRMLVSERGQFANTFNAVPRTEVKVLDGITPAAVTLYGKDKVLILNYQEPSSFTLIIEENVNKSFRVFFEQMWSIGKDI